MKPIRRIIDDTPAPDLAAAKRQRGRVFDMEGGPDPLGKDPDTAAVSRIARATQDAAGSLSRVTVHMDRAASAASGLAEALTQAARASQQRPPRPARTGRNPHNSDQAMDLVERLAAAQPGLRFAQDLLEQARYRTLTARQLRAAMNILSENNARGAHYALIPELFREHPSAVNRRNRLDISEAYHIARAPMHGSNPGAVYLFDTVNYTRNGEGYRGKITPQGVFMPRELGGEDLDAVRNLLREVNVDPVPALRAYGQRTGTCAICGRALSRHSEVVGYVGTTCAGRWGFEQDRLQA